MVSDVIYLDPDHVLDDGSVGDYIELYGQVVGATSSAIRGGTNWGTFLSAHLITGQSSGGSTPTPESWTPHDYLYVKNTDPDNIIPPLPGQVYFAGEGAPLADENYSSLRMMIISKFDQEGREIPFPEMWYGNQNPEVNISSANGKGRFYAESLTSSDDWDPLGGEETYYMIYLSNPLDTTYNTLTEGTLSEGDTVQIETSEEGYGVDWIAKDIKSPEHSDNEMHPPVTIPYAEVKYKNINLNGLFIGMTTEKGAYDNTAANIIIGEKPFANTTVNGEYIPGIYWNPYTVRGNIAIGSGMLPSAKAANDNLIIGNYSLGQLVEGDFNTSIGNYAGWGMTSGENNIFIGNSAEPKLELAKEGGEIKNQVVLGNEGMEALFLGKHQIFPFPEDLGGGSGGSTPEDLVWENKLAERVFDTVYTNDNDVPLYVQVSTTGPSSGASGSYFEFYIDGEYFGLIGGGANTGGNGYDNPFYIIPAGSTYEIQKNGTASLNAWHEARMPVAVGTGGKTVAFRAHLPATIDYPWYWLD